MGHKDFIFLAAVVFLGWCYKRSHQSVSAVDAAYQQDAASFAAMGGTNFTQSLWDPVNGQPTYMYGAVPVAVQGGLATQSNAGGVGSVFGHIA